MRTQIFKCSIGAIQTTTIGGAVYFTADSIADKLDFSVRKIAECIDVDDRIIEDNQRLIISEAGLYVLCYLSKSPERLKFKQWIRAEVLPQIKKEGRIREMSDDEIMAKALLIANNRLSEKDETIAELKQENESLRSFEPTDEPTDDLIGLPEYVSILNSLDIGIDEKSLCEWLRDNGFLSRQRGKNYNTPTKQSAGLLALVEESHIDDTSVNVVVRIPKITSRGKTYFTKCLLDRG